jgi:homoserine O-acetyltransferase/O-succinyltransferase
MTHHHTQSIGALRLQSGVALPDVTVAYACYGTLAPDGGNAILVTHGYTAGHDLLVHGSGVAEGSWAPLIGPGKALDPERYFIVCPNMLGSSYGSTGPGSVNPATGRIYGSTFPDLTIADLVASQYALLQALGVRHLRAVVGPSMGGFQALQWAIDHPGFVDLAAAIVSATALPPHPSMDLPALEQRLAADPHWADGQYAPGALADTLRQLRIETLNTYGMAQILAAQGLDTQDIDAAIAQQAAAWAQTFDPYALVVLMRAIKAFDVRAQLERIESDVLIAVARSDVLFPPDNAVRESLRRTQGRSRYVVMDTDFGHAASGPAHALWSPDFVDMLNEAGRR